MVQRRLCSYFKTNCKHTFGRPTTFFDLPEHVRYRIYRYARFVPDCAAYLVEKDGAPFLWGYDEEGYNPMYDYPTQDMSKLFPNSLLRLVSNVANLDISRAICLDNVICLDDRTIANSPMAYLTAPPLELLKWLRKLEITVRVQPRCYTAKSANIGCFKMYDEYSSKELAKLEEFMIAWKRFVDRLSLSPNVSKLTISLVCVVEDATVARQILAPLERLRVAKCRIQLGDDLTWQAGKMHRDTMVAIARQTVECVAGNSVTIKSPAFRFLDLPRELRLHVLSYTDLVAPDGEVQWGNEGKFSLHRHHGITRKLLWSHCEWQANDFCSHRAPVYPPCSCWQTPESLFLVCRTMLHDARAVFFSANRFIITTTSEYGEPHMRTQAFEASTFLTHIVPEGSLGYLRDIEIMFEPHGYNDRGVEPSILEAWKNAIHYAAPHLKKLTLCLWMGVEDSAMPQGLETDDAKGSTTALFQLHKQIARPLAQLRNLETFYVFAWSPYFTRGNTGVYTPGWWQPLVEEHERCLERLVMGSAYDSHMKGKEERQKSMWLTHIGEL